ncbi:MAG: 3'-5' exonuclease, partial [Paeniclostridium sordellii]|nr:3'-5' exonuclease [Paeniclostridium sordellii]
MNQEYIVVDLETTGLDPYKGCEIIEIGVTEINNNKIGRNYSRLIKPNRIIPTFITDITNISNEMVKKKKSLKEV